MDLLKTVYFLLLCSRVLTAQECEYDYPIPDDTWPEPGYRPACIKVESQATGTFQFDPLFANDVTFAYAIDDYSKEEIDAAASWTGATRATKSLERVGYWLEYSDANYTLAAEAETQFGVIFTNASGTVGGGNGGCDGVLGQECAENLKDALLSAMYSEAEAPLSSLKNLATAIGSISSYNNLSCPDDLFDDEELFDRKHILAAVCTSVLMILWLNLPQASLLKPPTNLLTMTPSLSLQATPLSCMRTPST
jgi:hypothetical protein